MSPSPAPSAAGNGFVEKNTNAPVASPAETSGIEVGEGYTVTATASKYDMRGGAAAGCYVDGCQPGLTRDGDDNTVLESRWSCEEALEGAEMACYITFEVEEDVDVESVTIWFRESDDATRPTNTFIISTAIDGGAGAFTQQLEGKNTPGTPLGEGEQFVLPTAVTARFIRIEAVLATDQWISLHEVEIYRSVTGSTGSLTTPSPSSTAIAGTPETPSPTVTAATAIDTPPPTTVVSTSEGTPAPITGSRDEVPSSSSSVEESNSSAAGDTPAPMEIMIGVTPSPTVVEESDGASRVAAGSGARSGRLVALVVAVALGVVGIAW